MFRLSRNNAAFVTLSAVAFSMIGVGSAVALQRHPTAAHHSTAAVATTWARIDSAVAYVREPAVSSAPAAAPAQHHKAAAPSRPAVRTVAAHPRARSAHVVRVAAASVVVTGPTGWPALDAAIARIPSYPAGRSRWVVSNRYGHWGTADWYNDTLYISPQVPTRYLYDVAVHEWSHELSVLDYGGDVSAAVQAMNANFGGGGSSGLNGAENAADCMARLQGATWTHYTTCQNPTWRQKAAQLLAGERL